MLSNIPEARGAENRTTTTGERNTVSRATGRNVYLGQIRRLAKISNSFSEVLERHREWGNDPWRADE